MTALSMLKKIKQKTRIRTRLRSIPQKIKTVKFIYKTNGMQGINMYIKDGVRKRIHKNVPVKTTGDVLFVTISEPLLERYRTDHMMESLESTGMSVDKIYYYDLRPDHIKRYNVFIFYRCPWLPEFEGIINDIKKKNKVSIYAVDDLVIDKKYTDTLPVVKSLNAEDRAVYDDGVNRHGKLMKRCDYAITTTKALADELKKYKELKEVYIDRNSMSDAMVYYAEKAMKEMKRDDSKVVIGYFSGTNTHNEDFQMVAPALVRIMKKYKNVYVKVAGRLTAPDALKEFEDRLIFTPYVDWRRLPFELCECDITLSPLVDTLFNRAKSEIKWSESALVQVPTIASNIGAFTESVKNGETGILAENTEDAWYEAISKLVENKDLREKIAKQAREYVIGNCRTIGNRAMELRNFIDRITPPVIAFGGVNVSALSGGNMVVKKHMDILCEAGNIVYGVESMDYHEKDQWLELNRVDDKKYDIFRINSHRKADKVDLKMSFDRFVATFWGSVEMVDEYTYMKEDGKKLYLVQNMEADFYKGGGSTRNRALATYRNHRIEPVTISRWCQDWLKSDFNRDVKYAPNGIDIDRFKYQKRDWSNRKVKILIEGDSSSEYKRVDESFEIANRLDRSKFEVSYMSYNAEPKDWYMVDSVYIKIPYEKVGKIYGEHDILIKSSVLESFSYPPLEIMATGGVPILVKNDGNAEYIVDGENALYYQIENIDDAVEKINKLVSDSKMFKEIARDGRKTAESYDWRKVKGDILALYE